MSKVSFAWQISSRPTVVLDSNYENGEKRDIPRHEKMFASVFVI